MALLRYVVTFLVIVTMYTPHILRKSNSEIKKLTRVTEFKNWYVFESLQEIARQHLHIAATASVAVPSDKIGYTLIVLTLLGALR
jgi:hypothetical protein